MAVERKKCPKCGEPMQWRGGKWVCMNPDCERFGERNQGSLSKQLEGMMGEE